jgi:hypothetical protein
MRARRGLSLTDVILAITFLLSAALPIIILTVQSSRITASARNRLTIELRARRHQAEVQALDFETLRSYAGGTLPIDLTDAGSAEASWLGRIQEETTIDEVEPGLIEATTRIQWLETGTRSNQREVLVRGYRVQPSLALIQRPPPGLGAF